MADNPTGIGGIMARARSWAKAFAAADESAAKINENDYAYGYDGVTVSMLLGSGKRIARSRIQIYEKYHYMAGDPIVNSAVRLHVTMALGGHETTGETVFIEAKPEFEKNKEAMKYVIDIQRQLAPLFNRIAHQMAFNGACFGDSYARIYSKEGIGVIDVYTDEMVYPPLVQPYERGNTTVGFVITTGQKVNDRLTIKQMVRLKMPRLLYVAQMRVIEKAIRMALQEDDIENLPILPALVGGSFLDAAEEAFDDMTATLSAMVSQRIVSAIDENMVGVNMEGMTKGQRKEFMTSLKNMLQSSKDRAERAVRELRPVTQRIFHLMPMFGEKQMTSITQFQGTSGNVNMSIEDVMIHLKRLAGALGIDVSMLGFADLLAGGLGEGGFYRTSAQAAERSRIIRTALTGFFQNIIDLHLWTKHNIVFEPGDRPYVINYFGSISALQAEQVASRERAVGATAALIGALEQLKGLGLKAPTMKQIIAKLMEMDEDLAEEIANDLQATIDEAKKQGFDVGLPTREEDEVLRGENEDKPSKKEKSAESEE